MVKELRSRQDPSFLDGSLMGQTPDSQAQLSHELVIPTIKSSNESIIKVDDKCRYIFWALPIFPHPGVHVQVETRHETRVGYC